MTQTQISDAVSNYNSHRNRYYREFLWGNAEIKTRPSEQDIQNILRAFSDAHAGRHHMHADYAEKIGISVLNEVPSV